jgi:hypothetical protein
MNTDRRVILLEFNELSPELMDRFIDEGHLPNFKRLRDSSQAFITEAAERGWELNPWVQWVTVHSGLDYRDHGIIELDEGPKLKAKRVWDVVSEAGLPVWICGSMNIASEKPLNGLVMPDPWSTKVQASDVLQPFFRFVQQNVLEHSTDRPSLGKADYARFMTFMMSHGLSFRTVDAIVRQLMSERADEGVRWKRAVLLDKLQFDVFRWFYRKLRPAFSTFFSNSTAHFQHYHWREMEPELFASQASPEKLAAHEGTILFGYTEMDKLIGRFLELADSDPGTILVFSTAISQQACTVYEEQGGKVMYRPRDIARLMKFANVTETHNAAPLMAEVFNVHLRNEEEAQAVESKLNRLRIDDRPAMFVQRKENVLTAKCQIHEHIAPDTRISSPSSTESFFDLFFELEDVKSGMHHPDGIFWVRMPQVAPKRYSEKVTLSSVAPTLLNLLSLPPARHMGAPIAALARQGAPVAVPELVGSASGR